MKTLYVKRNLLNYGSIKSWAEDQDFENILTEDDMHVTVAFSTTKLDWDQFDPQTRTLKIIGGERVMRQFGDASVLSFTSNRLQERWKQFREGGASWDFDEYIPHLTITYEGMPESVVPYDGELVLSSEVFSEIDENWNDKIIEDDL